MSRLTDALAGQHSTCACFIIVFLVIHVVVVLAAVVVVVVVACFCREVI